MSNARIQGSVKKLVHCEEYIPVTMTDEKLIEFLHQVSLLFDQLHLSLTHSLARAFISSGSVLVQDFLHVRVY